MSQIARLTPARLSLQRQAVVECRGGRAQIVVGQESDFAGAAGGAERAGGLIVGAVQGRGQAAVVVGADQRAGGVGDLVAGVGQVRVAGMDFVGASVQKILMAGPPSELALVFAGVDVLRSCCRR